ncbi:MAG: methyltransferase domain-containing protein [Kiritimatiellales bacterium]|nr:methyltransferase domain-containing protein [Kiritimatiellota bacterium]MBL7011628.1 methyltransferase domain-containing protein [Kiritimatiellales bacterium]
MKNIQKEHFEAEYVENSAVNPCHLHDTVFLLLKDSSFPVDCRVLDIGAGRGALLDRIPPDCKKVAVDISETAARQLSARGIEASCIDLDTEPLPCDPDSFDYIFCLEVIEHLNRPAETLREIHRTLKPSGRFIVSVPNIYQLLTPLLYLADIPPVNSARYGHVHVNDFTVRVLKKALRENGFNVLRIAGDEIFPLKDPVSRWIARKVPRMAHHLIAICEKA